MSPLIKRAESHSLKHYASLWNEMLIDTKVALLQIINP